jgi:hypothetical protein
MADEPALCGEPRCVEALDERYTVYGFLRFIRPQVNSPKGEPSSQPLLHARRSEALALSMCALYPVLQEERPKPVPPFVE